MGNGCSDKEADLSCLDRKPRKLLINNPFLKERNYNVETLFRTIEDGCNRFIQESGPLKLSSDKNLEDLVMSDQITIFFDGKKEKISVRQFVDFCKECTKCFDV